MTKNLVLFFLQIKALCRRHVRSCCFDQAGPLELEQQLEQLLQRSYRQRYASFVSHLVDT